MTEPNQQATEPDRDASPHHELGKGDRRRKMIRPLGLAIPIAFLSLVTACSGTPASTTPAAGSSVTAGGAGAAAAGSVLTGTVGQGDAFVITLVDSAGAPVTSVKAGTYTVKVKDMSAKHDFHLTGPGVDQKTSVPDTKEETWTVKLSAGTYTFACDPHAQKMVGTFTVT